MKKHELRVVLPQNFIQKVDILRKDVFGGCSRSHIAAIAIKALYDTELQKKTAPIEKEAA